MSEEVRSCEGCPIIGNCEACQHHNVGPNERCECCSYVIRCTSNA